MPVKKNGLKWKKDNRMSEYITLEGFSIHLLPYGYRRFKLSHKGKMIGQYRKLQTAKGIAYLVHQDNEV